MQQMTYSQASLHILIAEDDLNLGEALTGFLRDQGHRVDFAKDGLEALEYLEKNTYQLVIADLVMPKADGLAVLRAAKQKDKDTLVVVMTGYASVDSALEATRQGAYDYLRKPFKLQEINIAVANAARLLALHRENRKLLQKLNDLKAKLEGLEDSGQKPPESSPASTTAGETGPPSFIVDYCPKSTPNRRQADLARLQRLYQDNLITEQEYRTLKEHLHI